MGELESLLLVLALIYLSECLVWVRRGALAFRTWWGNHFRTVHSGSLLANQRGGLILANPLPPFGSVYVCEGFPLSLSPEGVLAYSSTCLDPAGRPAQTARYLPFDEINSIAVEGRGVLVNGSAFSISNSTFAARHAAESLRCASQAPKAGRAKAIEEWIRASLDARAVSRRLREGQTRARSIRILSILLFAYLFLGVVPFVWRFGFGTPGLWLLAGMFVQTVSIAFLYRRAHRSTYPGAEEEGFKPFLTMLLAPPTTIRASDLFSRHLLESFHPLAVAHALCRREAFARFARRMLLDLRYPLLPVCPTQDSNAAAAELWYRAASIRAVESFVQGAGLKLEELMAPPQPAEPANRSFCPRCGAQFVVLEGVCADCGGRPLQAFTTR